jgi:hypothetical protein
MSPGFHPHDPLPAEPTFDAFVACVGGVRVSTLIGKSPNFQNADYYFPSANVVLELKTIEEDFPTLPEYEEKLRNLRADQIRRGLATFGSVLRMEPPSREAVDEVLRLYRPRLNRMLDKANGQIKDTKKALRLLNATGLVIVANDRLKSLEPYFVVHLLANILMSRFSAVDGFVYVTLNEYVDLPGSDLANLLWAPLYSDAAPDSLVDFVDTLGRAWFGFLEDRIGPFQSRSESQDRDILLGGRMILKPQNDDAA